MQAARQWFVWAISLSLCEGEGALYGSHPGSDWHGQCFVWGRSVVRYTGGKGSSTVIAAGGRLPWQRVAQGGLGWHGMTSPPASA